MARMNIFFLDPDPAKAAQAHCDADIAPAIRTLCKVLSSVHYYNPQPNNYHAVLTWITGTPTSKNNVLTVWAATVMDNYLWLAAFGEELNREHVRRFKKVSRDLATLRVFIRFLPKLNVKEIVTPENMNPTLFPIYNIPTGYHILVDGDMVVNNEGDLIMYNNKDRRYFVNSVETYRSFYRVKKGCVSNWAKLERVPTWLL